MLFFWRNSSLGICTLIRLQAATIAASLHCQIPPPRHWLLCKSQWLPSSLTLRVPLLTCWVGKAQLAAFFPPLPSNGHRHDSAAISTRTVWLSRCFSLPCSAHLCSWCPLEILMCHVCMSLWALNLKWTCQKELRGGHEPVKSYLCSRGILKSEPTCGNTEHFATVVF